MRISIFLISIFLLKTTALAGHIGCVTIYERSLCETEQTIQYKSEALSWEHSKDEFKNKLLGILDKEQPGHGARVGNVFLWVNDFNSQAAMRVQVWTQDKSFIVDVPMDISNLDEEESFTVRAAGNIPYPVDFGYTLGGVIVSCVDECGQEHKDWLAGAGLADVQSVLPKMYLVTTPKFAEAKTVETLKAKADFNRLFTSVEMSPVLEGNGFRELAFSIFF